MCKNFHSGYLTYRFCGDTSSQLNFNISYVKVTSLAFKCRLERRTAGFQFYSTVKLGRKRATTAGFLSSFVRENHDTGPLRPCSACGLRQQKSKRWVIKKVSSDKRQKNSRKHKKWGGLDFGKLLVHVRHGKGASWKPRSSHFYYAQCRTLVLVSWQYIVGI